MIVGERRLTKRYGLCGRVEIPRLYTPVPLFGMVLDVSLSGCGICVPSGADFEPDEACLVELKFKGSYLAFRAVGAVRNRYVHAAYGGPMVGLEFLDLNARGREDIGALMRDQEGMMYARVA